MINNRSFFDVIILGAGASGLMAAIHAAERGRKTLVIDHANQAGRKMLVSGGGKCNITNRYISTADYYGADTAFCKFALKHFTPKSVLCMLQQANIETEEREHGRVFCKKGASEVVSYLVYRAKNSGVHFLLNTEVSEVIPPAGSVNEIDLSIKATPSFTPYSMKISTLAEISEVNSTAGFFVKCGELDSTTCFNVKCGELTFASPCLLLAAGGLAWPQLGATSFGYAIAKQFGHSIIPLKPALTGFILPPESPLHHLQGISLDVQLQIKGRNKVFEEPLLFTHQGFSGPVALQISCFWEKDDVVLINFLPSEDIISAMHKPDNGRLTVKNLVTQFLPERLAKAVIPELLSGRKVAELSRSDRKIIADCIHHYPVIPEAVEGFSKAEVTLGGVATSEINPKSMESLLLKGLFFSGEVIDITGKLGGYNIHWAFASGYVAGQNV